MLCLLFSIKGFEALSKEIASIFTSYNAVSEPITHSG